MTTTLPARLLDSLGGAFADLPQHRREVFVARLTRWWPDLIAGLAEVYDAAEELGCRVVRLAADAFAVRDDDLHSLDLARSLQPDWFQAPEALGYAAYADRFAGSIAGVGQRAAYLSDLGVSYLHLMPLLQPRPAPNDGGYAVADYRQVNPELGTVEDLKKLTVTLRSEGISLCLDLVLNHVAYEHPWAAAARAGDPRYRAYFYCFDDRTMPDAYDATVPEVFPAFAPGNFTFDRDIGAWVWTTFNSYQWDVAWANPDVFCEYADIVLWLANLGVEVLRLDAIAFIWKRLGTNCQNQSEVHALTQALRAITRIACPATIFQAEAIVGPRDLVQYLGTGSHHGKVSDLAYHNTLMVQIWSMLASRDVRLATHALNELPPTPSTTAWITYARCHDDIGWAIDDGDAWGVGLTGWGHRGFLSSFYSGTFPDSFARGLVFQENVATGDRRISGSLASLAGLEAAINTADSDAMALSISRILLIHAVIMGWGGLPVIWMGDELGLLSDPYWNDDLRYAADNRWAHRPRMPWPLVEAVTGSHDLRPHHPGPDDSGPDDHSKAAAAVLTGMRRLIGARSRLGQLHADVAAKVMEPSDPGVLLVRRDHPLGPLLCVYNMTEDWRPVPVGRVYEAGLDVTCVDRISGEALHIGDDGQVWLSPYAAHWLTRTTDGPPRVRALEAAYNAPPSYRGEPGNRAACRPIARATASV